MRKPHFRAVDDAVAHGLYEDEVVVVYGVVEEALDGSLLKSSSACSRSDSIEMYGGFAAYL